MTTMKKSDEKKLRASPTKIAYYIQSMSAKEEDARKIMLVMTSQFHKKDIKKFAETYRNCFNSDIVRYIANLIYSVPYSKLTLSVDNFAKTFQIRKKC